MLVSRSREKVARSCPGRYETVRRPDGHLIAAFCILEQQAARIELKLDTLFYEPIVIKWESGKSVQRIGLGGSSCCAPPTPPGMRVRTGRFEKLRLRDSWKAHFVEVGKVRGPNAQAGAL